MALKEAALTLTEPKLLLVEGKDDKSFFEALIRYLQLPSIQVIVYNGVSNLKPKLQAIVQRPEFSSKILSVAIIRDADKNYQDTLKSVRGALTRVGLPAPTKPQEQSKQHPRVQIWIMPNNHDPGALEDLCIRSIAEKPKQCIQDYLNCMKQANGLTSKNLSKSTAYAFIAAQTEPLSDLGVSAAKSYWDLTNPVFADVCTFMKSI